MPLPTAADKLAREASQTLEPGGDPYNSAERHASENVEWFEDDATTVISKTIREHLCSRTRG